MEILPDPEDTCAWKEIESQRIKWNKFIANYNSTDEVNNVGEVNSRDIWSDPYLWQNRRDLSKAVDDPYPSTMLLKKKLLSIVSYRERERLKLKSLLRGGVPPELRGKVWWASSGAVEKMKDANSKHLTKEPPTYYKALISRLGELNGSRVVLDIEKDIQRTFVDRVGKINEQYKSKEPFLQILRRILVAYALRNKKVGYCQSMNYICALLLFHVDDEEKVFFMLATIVENIVPRYYTPSLIGIRSDQLVFQTLVAHHFPRLFATFKTTSTLLEPIVVPWFLCLYINVLPLYAVCRVWDCFFWQGRVVLFRIGLNMIQSKERAILRENDFLTIYSILKSENNGVDFSFCLENDIKRDARRRRATWSPFSSDSSSNNVSDSEYLIKSTYKHMFPFLNVEIKTLWIKYMKKIQESDRILSSISADDFTCEDFDLSEKNIEIISLRSSLEISNINSVLDEPNVNRSNRRSSSAASHYSATSHYSDDSEIRGSLNRYSQLNAQMSQRRNMMMRASFDSSIRPSEFHSLALGMNEGKIGLDLVQQFTSEIKRIRLRSEDIEPLDEDIDI